LSILVTGFAIGVIVIAVLRKISLRYNILNQQGMPLVGGVAVAIVFMALCAIFIYPVFTRELKGIILSALLMLLFGIIDDWRELSVIAKFFVQVIATIVLISFGIKAQIVYIGNIPNAGITFLWIIGITNAFNHLDVTDGLAAGTAIMVSLSLFIIASINHDPSMALLALVLTASVLACFAYNFPPAKIYLGNAGSHFLGFLMAGIALAISYAPLERKIALLSPLVIFGLPIFDTAFLIMVRLLKKKLPFNKSNDHLALKLLANGYSKRKAFLIMFALCFFFCFFGILLSQLPNIRGIMVLFVIAVMVSFFLTKVKSKKVNQATVHG
jgi:UDP-GlcNAc:undecaprenyl-phosphate GlcNAc-1-phosphate transferase